MIGAVLAAVVKQMLFFAVAAGRRCPHQRRYRLRSRVFRSLTLINSTSPACSAVATPRGILTIRTQWAQGASADRTSPALRRKSDGLQFSSTLG